jgi:hypothetical protein
MRKIILTTIALTIIVSCTGKVSTKRNPSSVMEGKIDLIEKSKLISEEIVQNKFTKENCKEKFDEIETLYKKITPNKMDLSQIEIDGQNILDESFKARINLHSLLPIIPNECKLALKNVFSKMRSVEDLVGIMFYKDDQISADSIKYSDEPAPIYQNEKYHPYHVGAGLNSKEKFEFKNGDIMITKGISFVSSTISEIATPKSLYSHIVFVHVDEKTKEVTTIESYVGKGVGIYPIEEALKNENARILVLRAKDSEMASKASNYMFDKVQSLKAHKKFIPYDYNLDFSENAKLSCEEVAYDSFKTVSNGAVIIPEVMSSVGLSDEKFLKRVGVKKGQMMVPTDMETDSRFDIVLDWTDYRVMRDSWRKDAILGEMFRWSEEYQYQIHENLTSMAARLIWSTRYIPGVWGMMSKISGIPKDFTKDVPTRTIATMASLKTIGGLLLPEIKKADEEFFKAKGYYMTSEELRKVLEAYRSNHPKELEKVYRPKTKSDKRQKEDDNE